MTAHEVPPDRWDFIASSDPDRDRLYVCPLALGAVEIGLRRASGAIVRGRFTVAEIDAWLTCSAPTPVVAKLGQSMRDMRALPGHWAGMPLSSPRVMGILNATPDSFSDGGKLGSVAEAVAHAKAMLHAGADLIDIGGESTRPGAVPVDPEIEQARVIPIIRELVPTGAVISIDTRHPSTMAAALAAGAAIVNDVTALGSPGAIDIVAESGASVVLMHMQGEPQTMQAKPSYTDVVFDVFDFLEARVEACVSDGISRDRILVDTGIGFGKTVVQNCALIRAQGLFRTLGCGVLLGASRKGFIAAIAGGAAPQDRLGGSLAAMLAGVAAGANVVRVHDVRETVQALRVHEALSKNIYE